MPAPPLRAVLASSARQLAATSGSARTDAEVLLAHVLGISRSALLAADDRALGSEESAQFARLCARRARGEPVAYLTGRKEFWSLDLAVTPDVLVPRPETELLVEWSLELSSPHRRGFSFSVLDLGTGSGAIALAVAKERPDVRVVATDISPAALEVARANARRLTARIEFVEGDLFKALDPGVGRDDGPFDLIVSNPPYVAAGDPHLADLRFEPALALTAGADGLDAIRRIVAGAPAHLVAGGALLLEHGTAQAEAVRALLRDAGFASITTRRDLAGHERATGGVRP